MTANTAVRRALRIVPIVVLSAIPAWAQDPALEHPWSRGNTLALSGGVVTASDDTGAAFGGSIGWEVSPRVSVEGAGLWLDRQTGATAFAASVSVQAGLTKSHAAAPFVEGGFGMYMASFDPLRATSIPSFYADRMSGAGPRWFTDPAFFGGVGFTAFKTTNIAVRPALSALVAVDTGRGYTVAMFTVRIEYRFRDEPVPRP
jgi:hypothetical protein